MQGSHCRLYDENLVRNIMISTGVSIMEFVKNNKEASPEDVCDFVEFNADSIIAETIRNLNKENPERKDFDDSDDSDDLPSFDSEDDDESVW